MLVGDGSRAEEEDGVIEAHHIDITTVALKVCGLDTHCAAEAAFPDQIRAVLVEGFGAHIFGLNLASVVHFAVPGFSSKGKPTGRFRGYCWKHDPAMLRINLPDREVRVDTGAWVARGLPPDLAAKDPLARLLADQRKPGRKKGTQRGSTAADEMTFTAATIMAEWHGRNFTAMVARDLYATAAPRALCWCLHLVQDCCRKQHARGTMLQGHSADEGKAWDLWQELRHAKPDDWFARETTSVKPMSPRQASENNALCAFGGMTLAQENMLALRRSVAVIRFLTRGR